MKQLITSLLEEKENKLKGGLYHLTQIKFAYNTNRIEGNQLTEEQTKLIYETNTLDVIDNSYLKVDDIIETINHFDCFDYMLNIATQPLTEDIIKEFHSILKKNTSHSKKSWFNVGDYKKLKNTIGDRPTTSPESVQKELSDLINTDNENSNIIIDDIVDFHYSFEKIHPFQDGNGRVGRLIMFKECLKNNIAPFVIEDKNKVFYYRGLNEYEKEKGFLLGTCLSAQDDYKSHISYFYPEYEWENK